MSSPDFLEYQRLIEENPNAKVFDTQPRGTPLFERFHITEKEVFGACLRRSDPLPIFEFLIPKARLQ